MFSDEDDLKSDDVIEEKKKSGKRWISETDRLMNGNVYIIDRVSTSWCLKFETNASI
jgi:hypothetical protein